MSAAAIETHDLHMHYGEGQTAVRALDGVDLVIGGGEGPIVIAVAVASVILGVLAAILPARRAARLQVINALSYE